MCAGVAQTALAQVAAQASHAPNDPKGSADFGACFRSDKAKKPKKGSKKRWRAQYKNKEFDENFAKSLLPEGVKKCTIGRTAQMGRWFATYPCAQDQGLQ